MYIYIYVSIHLPPGRPPLFPADGWCRELVKVSPTLILGAQIRISYVSLPSVPVVGRGVGDSDVPVSTIK